MDDRIMESSSAKIEDKERMDTREMSSSDLLKSKVWQYSNGSEAST